MRTIPLNIALIVALLLSALRFAAPASAQGTPPPDIVGLPGTHQDELGCPGEWQPECEATLLTYDEEDDVWQATFEIQPANDDDKKGPRYKVALNGGWGENYGLKAERNGPDIPLVVSAPTLVKFYYDHKTHWITDNFNTPIFVAVGDFQQQMGCASNDDATCLRSWLEDPDGDGVYDFATRALKAGTYSVAVALGEDSANLVTEPQSFTVQKDRDEIYFGYDAAKEQLTISTTGAPVGNLTRLRAHWVSADTLLWYVTALPGFRYTLVYSPQAALELSPEGIANGEEIPLTLVSQKHVQPGRALLPRRG